jgi:nitrite reductase (NO-forming)
MTSDPLPGGHPAQSPSTDAGSPAGRPPTPPPVAPAGRPPTPPREPPARPPLAVPLALTAPRPAGGPFQPGPRRADDRRIALSAVAVAAAYLVAAMLAALAGALGAPLVSPWLPLHLALAGGASTAIAGIMPFFVAALAAGAPAPSRLRKAAVGFVALGAGLVAVRGIAPGEAWAWAPVVGGWLYLTGILWLVLAVRASGQQSLMVRRPLVSLGYTLALVNVAVGGVLGTLFVAGWTPILERWTQLRPAHAWTNVIGFVSLVIVATLLHFLPTVLGGRIMPRRSAAIAVLGIAIGTPVVVLGLLAGSGPVAGGGAALVMAGTVATALEALLVVRARGSWTSDPGWHRFASIGLLAGVAWFVVGVSLASWLLIRYGAVAEAWSTAVVGAPLAIGWIVQVLLASWTHLLPSIGPGTPVQHGRQRAILGRIATPRLLALNAGVALLAIGWPMEIAWAVAAGGLLAAAAVVTSVALALVALRLGR